MQIEILHVRDPDDGCDMQVFVDGQRVDWWTPGEHTVVVDDVDPGRGWDAEEWQDETDEVAANDALSEQFRAAIVTARNAAADSPYVT